MKKTYVKPVMEIEGFVANEYVAACWYVYCEGSNGIWGTGIGEHDSHEYIARSLKNEPTLEHHDTSFFYRAYDSYRTPDGENHYRAHKENHDEDGKHPNASF